MFQLPVISRFVPSTVAADVGAVPFTLLTRPQPFRFRISRPVQFAFVFVAVLVVNVPLRLPALLNVQPPFGRVFVYVPVQLPSSIGNCAVVVRSASSVGAQLAPRQPPDHS